jgi:dTDP-4-dehydrorhamnose 3,5-epimerase
VPLSEDGHEQLYVPPGFAHGFCVTSEEALFFYKCTDIYSPESEHGVAWDDPGLSIPWPESNPVISKKDQGYPNLEDIPHDSLFSWGREL